MNVGHGFVAFLNQCLSDLNDRFITGWPFSGHPVKGSMRKSLWWRGHHLCIKEFYAWGNHHYWLKNHGWETSLAPLPRSRSAPQVYQRWTCDVWRRCGEQIAPSESSNSRSECSIQTGEESKKKWGINQRKWCFSQETCRFMQQNRGLRIVYIDIRMWDFDGFCRFCHESLNIANC